MNTLICPECGRSMKLTLGKFGWFYACVRYPWGCRGTHSAHQETKEPMGIPGNQETKFWRHKAHKIFDGYWKKWKVPRTEAYRQLRILMGLTEDQAHISKFDVEQCMKVIELYRKKRPGDLIKQKKKKVILPRKEFFKKLQSGKLEGYPYEKNPNY